MTEQGSESAATPTPRTDPSQDVEKQLVATPLEPGESQVMRWGFRQREEVIALIFGFATGMAIAAIFLLYVVFDAAKLLP